MKKKSKMWFFVGVCILVSLVSIWGTVSWTSRSNPKVETTGTTNKASLAKLKNSTAEEAARTALRALCENDYPLFLLILDKPNSVEVQDRFESMKKSYVNQNYKALALTLDPSNKDTFKTFVFDNNGKQKFWNWAAKEDPYYNKLWMKRKLDNTYYLSELLPERV